MYSIHRVLRSAEQWAQEKYLVLFAWGILNPNGPTLSCVGIRRSEDDKYVEVFVRWMHFLEGETHILGFVDLDQGNLKEAVLEILGYAFSLDKPSAMRGQPLVTSIPSFVTMPGGMVSTDDVCHLMASSPEFRNADWGREWYYLKKHGSDFFARAAEESREAYESEISRPEISDEQRQFLEFSVRTARRFPAFSEWKPGSFHGRAFHTDDVGSWWNVVAETEFKNSAVMELGYMWVGAIHQYQLPNPSKPIAESFDEMRDFLASGSHALWSSDISTEFLLEILGLGNTIGSDRNPNS